MSKRKRLRQLATVVVAALALGSAAMLGGMPALADGGDDDPPLTTPPGPGDITTMEVPFSVPIAFSVAVTQAAAYPGVVRAIRYSNAEVLGEYSYGSGVTPAQFEAEFLASYGTTPAAVALVVETTVPNPEESALARQITSSIDVGVEPFVPEPASFAPEVEALLKTPAAKRAADSNVPAARLAGVTDWRPSFAEIQVTNYVPNRVTFIYSYWWTNGTNRPSKVPSGFGVEFELNMYATGYIGTRGSCSYATPPYAPVYDYKKVAAAENQNWNWRVVRPDGVTAPNSLGAYADYNDWLDDCNRSSFGIGLRFPQNIQYVNGAYGILFVIDAPKGWEVTSKVGAVNQVVSDSFCNTLIGLGMSLTDCMGVTAGDWTNENGPKAQIVLNQNHNWYAPRKCFITDWSTSTAGVVTDTTPWMCPPL